MGISNDDRKGYGRHGIRAQHGDAQRQNASVQPTHVVRSDIQSPYVEKPGGGVALLQRKGRLALIESLK